MIDQLNALPDFSSKLIYIYEHFDISDIEDIRFFLSTPEVRKFILFVSNQYANGNTFTDTTLGNIGILVEILKNIYEFTSEETSVSNEEFDILYEILEEKDLNLFTQYAQFTSDKVSTHRYKSLRGSIGKVYSFDDESRRLSLYQWVKRQENKYKQVTGETINLFDEDIYCFPKWDGVSVIHEKENGNVIRSLTRGNVITNEAQDITDVCKLEEIHLLSGEDQYDEYGLKTEAIIQEEVYEEYNATLPANKQYKSARALVQSILLSDESFSVKHGLMQMVEFKQLRVSTLNPDGSESLQKVADNAFDSPYIKCKLGNFEAIEKFAYDHKIVEGCRCDGVVLYIMNEDIQKVLGRENNKNNFEVAYKFSEEVGYTKLEDVRFQTGPLGNVTPIAVVKPIVLRGKTITNISLGSLRRLQDLCLRKGNTVKIACENIPYLSYDVLDDKCKESDNPIIALPVFCPECGVAYDGGTFDRVCNNPKCNCRKKGYITNYLNKIGVKGIQYETVSKLFDAKVITRIEDLYDIKLYKSSLQKVQEIEGFGKVTWMNLINSIQNNKTITASVLFSALGIKGLGRVTAENIFKLYSIEEVIEFAETETKDFLLLAKNVGKMKVEGILSGIMEKRKLIEYLVDKLTIIPEETGPCCFTVNFHVARWDKDLEEFIKQHKGRIEGNLKKSTSFLVVPDEVPNSVKVTKANEYDIPVIPISKVKEHINEFYPLVISD